MMRMVNDPEFRISSSELTFLTLRQKSHFHAKSPSTQRKKSNDLDPKSVIPIYPPDLPDPRQKKRYLTTNLNGAVVACASGL